MHNNELGKVSINNKESFMGFFKNLFIKSNLKQYNATKFITGMRGYSILAVFLIHSGGGGLREFSHLTNEIVDKGKYGVISFFVISAFTIAMSIDKSISSNVFNYLRYLLNRWLRIFPLFFIVALYAFIIGGNSYYLNIFNVKNNLINFISQISLLNVFFVKHKNNLIGVEWILPIEFFYYLLFPIFFTILSSIKKNKVLYALLMLIILAISLNSDRLMSPFYSHSFTSFLSGFSFGKFKISEFFNPNFRCLADHWGLLKYLFTFMAGFTVYFIYKSNYFKKLISEKKYSNIINNVIFIAILLVGITLIVVSKEIIEEIIVTIFMCLLLLASYYRGFLVRLLFENPIIMHIGKISYSFYLIHLFVLGFVKQYSPPLNMLISLIFAIILSTATYYLIEKPFVNLGRIFYRRKSNT